MILTKCFIAHARSRPSFHFTFQVLVSRPNKFQFIDESLIHAQWVTSRYKVQSNNRKCFRRPNQSFVISSDWLCFCLCKFIDGNHCLFLLLFSGWLRIERINLTIRKNMLPIDWRKSLVGELFFFFCRLGLCSTLEHFSTENVLIPTKDSARRKDFNLFYFSKFHCQTQRMEQNDSLRNYTLWNRFHDFIDITTSIRADGIRSTEWIFVKLFKLTA